MATITEQDIRFELATRDFSDFLPFVKILEPPPGRGIIPFEVWSHLMEVAKILSEEKLIVWLKSRQTGASWELAAYALWTAQFKEGAKVLEFSQTENDAKSLLYKSRFIREYLPDELQVSLGTDNTTEMTFPSMYSAIKVFPSTPSAGRGETATLVIMDEADYHEYLEANYAAVKPTIDDSGGQLVMVSTANRASMSSTFKDTYRAAPDNGYRKLFYPWQVRPSRNQEWYEARKSEYLDATLFEKEYPNSEEEALAPPRALAAFDMDALVAMEQDTKEPIETIGIANVYQKYQPGKAYAVGTDTSHGVGADYSVTAIIDAATGYIVADIISNVIPPEDLTEASYTLLEAYGFPIWGIENNEWGGIVLSKARELRYPRIYERQVGRSDNAGPKTAAQLARGTTPGWHTDERTRPLMWGELISAVRSRLVTIPSKQGLNQFYAVIRNPDKNGRPEAMRGANDDYPTAVAIAWQMRKYAHATGRSRSGGNRSARIVRMRRAW